MTLTPERIAEIERHIPIMFPADDAADFLELVRLARLGLRVEAAPTTRAKITPTAWKGPTWLAYQPLPNEWGGKRVALVVLEDNS